MDADDWLKSIEKKLQVVQCSNHEKVLLASHQHSSPVADWWDAYMESHEEPESMNWPKFWAAFSAHHVPQGVIKLKKKEFQDLKQGSMSVNGYITKFTQLSNYAPHEVDTDEKKQECFLNDLNDGLAYALEAQDFENFQGMVNKAQEESSWCVSISHAVALGRMSLRLQLDQRSVLLSHCFSRSHR
jgi:hypothetical protein